jgi:hypothetical protein
MREIVIGLMVSALALAIGCAETPHCSPASSVSICGPTERAGANPEFDADGRRLRVNVAACDGPWTIVCDPESGGRLEILAPPPPACDMSMSDPVPVGCGGGVCISVPCDGQTHSGG